MRTEVSRFGRICRAQHGGLMSEGLADDVWPLPEISACLHGRGGITQAGVGPVR
jgi:hypothetical protein